MKTILFILTMGLLLSFPVSRKMPLIYAVASEKQIASSTMTLTPTPTMTPRQIVANARHGEEIAKIWMLESTMGKNTNPIALHNQCKSIGKTNEFGFDPQHKTCFDTFQEAVDTVDAWFDKRDKEAHCYWNIGVRTADCPYAEKMENL